MRAVYLTGEDLYLRALVAADKECAAAWFDSPFPVNAVRAEAWLKETHASVDRPRDLHYAIVRTADDTVIGGMTLETNYRIGALKLRIAHWLPEADALRAAVLRILYPWLRDDLELMTFVIHIPADQPETIAAAEHLGMTPGVRLREAIARPGHRVDELIYQALLTPWAVRDA
ncbi:MAG: GNAT family N-acetyltransferase [Thermomicrobiales bacterium]